MKSKGMKKEKVKKDSELMKRELEQERKEKENKENGNELMKEELKEEGIKEGKKEKERKEQKNYIVEKYNNKRDDNDTYSSSTEELNQKINQNEQDNSGVKMNNIDEKVLIHLKDDQDFCEESVDITKIINEINEHNENLDTINIKDSSKRIKKFIFTPEALQRLTLIYNYLKDGVPVLLEGPTGTSKTLSVEIVCELFNYPLIRFNLSSETKATDLLGRYVGDQNSWAGIRLQMGQFIDAFENGKVLLLDEINLASQECLQFIEEALDSGEISTELPGKPLLRIKMHPNFRLIATQNPNKGLFAHKRKDLGQKFISRFQVINFPEFSKEELRKIALGLAEQFHLEGEEGLINDLVSFHIEWSNLPEIAEDIQCFTVREIAATVRAIANGNNPLDTVLTIYGARYTKDKREKLMNLLKEYSSFNTLKKEEFEYPKSFPKCFHNNHLSEALKSIFFSFKNNRHVILAGAEGTGITQIARWISQYYDQENEENEDSSSQYFCVCTEEIKCADLIGRQKPSDGINSNTQELLKWQSGFLSEAIEKGKCTVLDSIDEAPSTVTERLNALLDQKYDEKQKYFEIPENPNQSRIAIHSKFRLLCTCHIEKLNYMSPAFINRFDVIVLENQLENIRKEEMISLISLLMNYKYTSNQVQKSDSEVFSDVDSDEESYYYSFLKDDPESDDEPISNNNEIDYAPDGEPISNNNEIDYVPDNEIIELITKEVNDSMTMLQLSQFCKAVAIYSLFFPSSVSKSKIIDLTKQILKKDPNEKDFELDDEIKNYLINDLNSSQNILNDNDDDDDQFFFLNSELLQQFIAKLYAASLIHLPVCVYGPTGVGKTSAARAFAKIRPLSYKSNTKYKMHSFHSGTKSNNFYGTTTIKDGKIIYINGTLTDSLRKGYTFIADEMNLSSITTMKALAPALDPSVGNNIFVPGIGETIEVNSSFFFIACQNELGTIGRNAVPSSIASRFRYFNYPKQTEEDLSSICKDICNSIYKNGKKPSFKPNDAELLGKFMIELNNSNQRCIPQWSLRDITKIFKRAFQQDERRNEYLNITLYHNILFYSLSSVNQEDCKSCLPFICDLIGKIFFNDSSEFLTQRDELNKCFNISPEIQKRNNGTYLMKGECGILFEFDPKIRYTNSLLNSMFQILLTENTEPVLLMGPSGFKTFLSQQFLREAKVITLNQESTIAQLLGSSSFLTDIEAKLFYIEIICKICHIYNSFPKFSQKLMNNTLSKNDILNETSLAKEFLPNSFGEIINHLIDKLFNNSMNNNKTCVIENIALEFRPGLLLSAFLEGRSLILKNLSNLPTIVLERFNELFSGKHIITLNEDIHNTFTTSDNKVLNQSNQNIRFFATCPLNSASKLSEAVLSRFTVLNISGYKNEEQQKALLSYIQFNDLNVDTSNISILYKLSDESIISKIGIHLSFLQMINILEMTARLNENSDPTHNQFNMGIIIYRVLNGVLEKRIHRQNLQSIIIEAGISIPPQLDEKFMEEPLIVTNENGYRGVKSKITGLFIKSPNAKAKLSNTAFIPTFTEMVDIIHLGIVIKIPVILEGPPGQGKQTAIKYIADYLGFNIINIIISRSTKVDDLLGKLTISRDENNNIHVNIIETKLVKAFKSNSEMNNTIIVFHNINNASPAVLEVLASIFDHHQHDILLPDGNTIYKGKMNIIGIFNPKNNPSNRDKLPNSLIYSSIYHIVNSPEDSDVFDFIITLFSKTNLKEDALVTFDHYKITKQYAAEINATPLTLNDLIKYILFRRASYGCIDRSLISQMVFAYRFIQQESIQYILSMMSIGKMSYNPQFILNLENQKLLIKISEESKKALEIPINDISNVNEMKIQEALASLTIPQKHCMTFMACSLLAKRTCILQGNTASGKSFLVRLFAQMLGQKLVVYQMNSDTGMSILTGQSIISDSISFQEDAKIDHAYSELCMIPYFREYLEKNNFKRDKKHFSALLQEIQKYNQKELSQEQKRCLSSAHQKIIQILSPANRFHHEESAFIKAIRNGEWVLIDGIELAPPEIAEKISSLCGDDPELDLTECGEECYFTKRKTTKSQQIHDNFFLLITYNPSSQNEIKTLDSDLINKCCSFSLSEMDSKEEYSAQILLGSLVNQSYPSKFSIEIAARMAMLHSKAKKKSQSNKDLFAGDLQFTGRTLTFIEKEIKYHTKNSKLNLKQSKICKPICNSINAFYCNSVIDSNKREEFRKDLIAQFSETPPLELLNNIEYPGMNQKEKNKSLLLELRNLQLYVCNKISYNFNFLEFTNLCLHVKIMDVPFILNHLQDTKNLINDNTKMQRPDDILILEKEYSQIGILVQIFHNIQENIKNVNPEYYNTELKDKDLLMISELQQPIMRLNLLHELEEQGFSFIFPGILYDEHFFEIMQIIKNLSENIEVIKTFSDFIYKLKLYKELIPYVERIFPYHIFQDGSSIVLSKLIKLLKILNEKQISFNVEIDNQSYKFEYDKMSNVEINYIFNENDPFLLSYGSIVSFYIKINNKIRKKHYSFDHIDPKKESMMEKTLTIISLTNYVISTPSILEANFKEQYKVIIKESKTKSSHNTDFPITVKSQLSSFYKSDVHDLILISKIITMIFLLPTEKLQIISFFIHKLEAYVLFIVHLVFSSLIPDNVQNVHDFLNWMASGIKPLGDENSILWRIMNNSFRVPLNYEIINLKGLIQEINQEIKYLESSPIDNQEKWPTELFIEDLNNQKSSIKKLIDEKNASKEDLDIKNNIQDLIRRIDSTEIKKDKHKSIRKQIITQLKYISQNTLNQNDYQNCVNMVQQFFYFIKENDSEFNKKNILWPVFQSSVLPNQSNNFKDKELFLDIIWFSKAKALLDTISKSSLKTVYSDVMKLSEFPELNSMVQFLFNRLNSSSNSIHTGLSVDDMSIMYSTLNALFIFKLYKSKRCSFSDIVSLLNDLSERKEITNENEIEWIHEIANQFSSSFVLTLPRLKPNDLFYLIINYQGELKEPLNGPLISKTEASEICRSLQSRLFNDFKDMKECSDTIAKIIYNNIYRTTKADDSDHEGLKDLLSTSFQTMENPNNKQLLQAALNILSIADNLNDFKDYEFKFDDIKFIRNQKWLQNKEYINRYPSLVFWLCKNQKCMKQLQYIYEKSKLSTHELPFWIFVLRIMSAKNCISFDSKPTTETGKLIKQLVTDNIKKIINKSSSIGTEWLSLILSNVPAEITDACNKIFYQFFTYLSEDDYNNNEIINKIKYESIKNFIKNICDMSVKGTLQCILKEPIKSCNEDTSSFIKDPENFIKERVLDYRNKMLQEVTNSNEFKILSDNFNKLRPEIDKKIEFLEQSINEETESRKKCFKQEQEKKYNKDFGVYKKKLHKSVKEYNDLFYEISEIIRKGEEYLNFYNYNKKILELLEKGENLIEIEEDQSKTSLDVTMLIFSPLFPFYSPKYIKIYDKRNIKKLQQIQFKRQNFIQEKQIFYFPTKYYSNYKFLVYNNDPKNTQNIKIYPLKTNTDYRNQFEIKYKLYTKISAPSLIFGKDYNQKDSKSFINMLQQFNKKIDTFIHEIQKEFSTGDINDQSFKKPEYIIEYIKNIQNYFNVKYTDGKESEIQNLLNNLIYDLNQILKDIKSFQFFFIEKNIKNDWINSSQFNFIFNSIHHYSLPFPSDKPEIGKINLLNIKNIEYLSSPILSIDKNSISCCYNALNITIGPIIPILYSKKTTMNFISFIDNPVTVDIENVTSKDGHDYSRWFTAKHTFTSGEIIQIFISLPPPVNKNIENIEVSLNLKIQSPPYKELNIPCTFFITLLPLSIFLSCKEYSLSYHDDSFNLCTQYLMSNSDLSLKIQNYNHKDAVSYAYQIESCDDNESPKPDVNKSKNGLSIHIPSLSNKIQRLHFNLHLQFSERFSTEVRVNAAIIPFDYSFYIYDFTKKKYISNNLTIFFSNDLVEKSIPLHCILYIPSFINQLDCDAIIQKKISCGEIENYSYYQKFPAKSKKFTLMLKIHPNLKNYEYNEYNSISLQIKGIEKKIQIRIIRPQLYEVKDYSYQWINNEWVKAPYNFNPESECYINPFFGIKNPNPKIKVTYKKDFVSVENGSNNIFISYGKNGEIKKQSNASTESLMRNIDNGIPIFGIYMNKWYPLFKTYPQSIKNWEKLELDPINVENAKKDLEKVNERKFFQWNARSATDFLVMVDLLKLDDLTTPNSLICINNLIDSFPDSIKKTSLYWKNLKDCGDIIPNIMSRDQEDLLYIISHNLIYYFYILFKSQYEKIEKQSYSIILDSIPNDKVPSKIKELCQQYYTIDSEEMLFDPASKENEQFHEVKKALKNLPISDISVEDSKEAFLITYYNYSNFEIQSKLRNDKPNIIISSKKYHLQSDKDISISLPDISSEFKREGVTIENLSNFYLSCLKGTRILPIYIRSMKIQNNKAMEKTASNYFLKLLQVYRGLPKIDNSLISYSVNSFISSFCSMIGKFKLAGITFSNLPTSCQNLEEHQQDFIQYPEKDDLFLPQENWTSKAQILSQNSKYSLIGYPLGNAGLQFSSFHSTPSNQNIFHQDNQVDNISTNNERNISEENDGMEVLDDIQFDKLIKIRRQQELDEIEQENDDLDIEIQEESSNEQKTKIKISSNDIEVKSKKIKSEQFDGSLSHFTEEEGIKRTVARISQMDSNKTLNIYSERYHLSNTNILYDANFPCEDRDKYSIIPLIVQSYILSQEFIKVASDPKNEISFSNIAVNILVDCSSFISDENKIFNMFIICALTDALTALEIPYSAAVIADQNFKCIIKTFDEDHSFQVLQRICDCLLIKRYKTKLASSIKFAIDSMQYTYDKNRNQRAIFTFSDGLDEQLILTKSWKDSILINPDISIGFVFIKSALLLGKNLEIVQDMWKNFETQTNVSIANIKAEISEEVKNELNKVFINVMSRKSLNSPKNTDKYEFPTFSIEDSMCISSLKNISTAFQEKFQAKDIYIERTDVLKTAKLVIDKIDAKKYLNKMNSIATCKTGNDFNKSEYEKLLMTFINREKLNISYLETIFKPNKASQAILSTTGTEFDITALILNIINPVPDPMIYLEEKGGLIRNYSVSVIIDLSISCFYELSASHSIQTIHHLLSALALFDLPSFDLILTGDPIPTVLCSEVGTFRALSPNSNIWKSLFVMLENPNRHADLASAIHTAFDLRRMRSTEYTNILFVLTDGLYQNSERPRIVECVNNCVQSGINTIGVGIGIYPKGIEKLFPQIIFSPNPENVMKGIATLFGDNPSNVYDEMPSISFAMDEQFNFNLKEAISKIINNKENPVYKNLKEELHEITPTLESFEFINPEFSIIDEKGDYINPPEGTYSALYTKDILKTQKILIVMLWDCSLNQKEGRALDKQYIFTSPEPGRTECIKSAVDHYGIELEVVQNYEDAIDRLLRQTKPGFCDYYATWVICGPPYPVLPYCGKDSDPHLVGQFIDVLIQFWKNGGSLVFWAEGDPLYAQVNWFLEKVEFENEPNCPSGKTNLRITGEHLGNTILKPDESPDLIHPQTFNRSPLIFKESQRTTPSHNTGKLYEGYTISYALYDLEKIKPFIPFARDSGENQTLRNSAITSMFYPANLKTGTGDIVIDCGYTKLFSKITTDGTFRYIQNIAGWTGRPEIHKRVDGIEPSEWRPKAISFEIKKVKWPKFKSQVVDKVDIVFCIDATGSMENWIEAAKKQSQAIANSSHSNHPGIHFNFGVIFYRDPIDSRSDKNEFFQPTNSIQSLVSFMSTQVANGGGDGPEDWVGAYSILLDQINWRPGAARAVIHIADAPAHGTEWGGDSKHQIEGPKLYPLIKRCANEEIFFTGINVLNGATQSFNRIKAIYSEQKKEKFYTTIYSIESVDSNVAAKFLSDVTANVISQISAF